MNVRMMRMVVGLVAFQVHAQDKPVRAQQSFYYPDKGAMSVTTQYCSVIPYLLYKRICTIASPKKTDVLSNSQIDFRGLAAMCLTGAAVINREPLIRAAFRQYRKLMRG